MNAFRHVFRASLIAALAALAACETTPRGIAFHERAQAGLALDLSAGTAPEPLSLGFAWKREVFAVIPRASPGRSGAAQSEGEAQSLISVFRAGRRPAQGTGAPGGTYEVHSAFATGAAAATIAGNPAATLRLTGAAVSLEEFTGRVRAFGVCRQALLVAEPDGGPWINRAATELGWQAPGTKTAYHFVQSFDLARADFTDQQLRQALCVDTSEAP